jgi:hypothetical protein
MGAVAWGLDLPELLEWLQQFTHHVSSVMVGVVC